MPKRGQPPDDPSSAPESGTVREFVEEDDDLNSPANTRGSAAAKSTNPNRRPADRRREDDPSRAPEER